MNRKLRTKIPDYVFKKITGNQCFSVRVGSRHVHRTMVLENKIFIKIHHPAIHCFDNGIMRICGMKNLVDKDLG
jgi:hypothetical protein